ncbi:dienelactone hydrolase family protein [Arcobacter sp. CECT 8985]|uniref:dienelactone hydrolase family protein n=1 Tax=Arcobacter sp. CECT 8985 TaxID=1935424 RepID=UPI00100BE403|nr:dienelactone hydrolase family protein [Arcobacter sp. CECT 8985]RXJ86371.1 hypothetical protein CRU93_08770 [Arcobacter sp. CECT 8985]
MKILVLTDIFGKVYLSNELINFTSNLNILDPYEDEKLFFLDEQEAYESFIKKCGHEKYFEKALNICKKENIDVILGFSAGGTVAWRLASLHLHNLKKVICFYPSLIRKYLQLEPKVNTNIFFAKYEKCFDTKQISNILLEKENIKVEISIYNHGFMNKKSKNYNNIAFENYLEKLKKMVFNI